MGLNYRTGVEKEMEQLLDAKEWFIGPNVHSEVTLRCKYPDAWTETLQRYVDLVKTRTRSTAAGAAASVYSQFYLDLCVTVLARRIVTVDIHHIVSAADDPLQRKNKETSDMCTIHAIMFKMTLSRVLTCVCECLLRFSPNTKLVDNIDKNKDDDYNTGIVADLTARLYDRIEAMLKEKYYKNQENGRYYGREKALDLPAIVHDLVHDWLIGEALPELRARSRGQRGDAFAVTPLEHIERTKSLTSHPSFFAVSHCYWLWLHLTAAGLQTAKAESDFLTVFYAFDLFIYCPQCSAHFVQHRRAFYTRKPYTVSVQTTETAQSVVFNMHNVINHNTGADVLPPSVMTDYTRYWERYRLIDAGA